MELLTLIAVLSVFALLILVSTGIWAVYWAVVRGFQQVIIGLQAIEAARK